MLSTCSRVGSEMARNVLASASAAGRLNGPDGVASTDANSGPVITRV
ncbi:hypothetical protein ACFPRL_35700 [Pseudoclavibacter helvolus]